MTKKAAKTTKRRAKPSAAQKQSDTLILNLFIDLCDGDDLGPFLEHINFDWAPVPANANPEQFFEAFKGHYTNDGVLDGEQPFNELATYPRYATTTTAADSRLPPAMTTRRRSSPWGRRFSCWCIGAAELPLLEPKPK